MIRIIRAADRHYSDFGWLKTCWLFSFSEYYDPENIQFSALRVFNDDVMMPGTGFPTHPHREMEIITVVLDGEVTHADSMGNRTVIRSGDIQRMTAGTGLTHSEYNLGQKPVSFFQIWFHPDLHGLTPSYEQTTCSPDRCKNRLSLVASGRRDAAGSEGHPFISFHTDAAIYRGSFEEERTLHYRPERNRKIFMYIIRGEMVFNDWELGPRDQIRLDPEQALIGRARSSCELILIDLPSCRGLGYDREVLRGDTVSR